MTYESPATTRVSDFQVFPGDRGFPYRERRVMSISIIIPRVINEANHPAMALETKAKKIRLHIIPYQENDTIASVGSIPGKSS